MRETIDRAYKGWDIRGCPAPCLFSGTAPAVTQLRDADREVSLHRGGLPLADSVSLAAQLLGKLTTPSQAAIKAEQRIYVQEALNSMDPIDREVLALKH